MAGKITVSTLNDDTGVLATQNGMSGIAKAWVAFNGSGGATIRASFNVSSVTRNSTGNYTITFTTAMPDANYSAVGNSGTTASDHRVLIPNFNSAPTASVCGIQTSALNSSATDDNYINFAVFR